LLAIPRRGVAIGTQFFFDPFAIDDRRLAYPPNSSFPIGGLKGVGDNAPAPRSSEAGKTLFSAQRLNL